MEERKSGGGSREKKEQKLKYNNKKKIRLMELGVEKRGHGRRGIKTEKVSEKGKGIKK